MAKGAYVARTADAVALADVLSAGVALVSADGVLEHVNPAFARVFDAEPGSPDAGTPLRNLAVAEPFRHAAQLWQGWSEPPGRKYRCQLYGPHVVEGVWHTLDTGGQRVVVVSDVTGDARVRSRLRQHNRALAELLATKTELVSALLHELRTPLAAARSMAQLLPGSTGDALLDEAMLGVGRNLDRLDQVIGEIATISGIENGTIDLGVQPVDLAALLAGVPGATTTVTGNGPVAGDQRRLAEVFERLVAAVRAVRSEPGPLAITAREEGGEWLVALPLPLHGAADQLFTSTGSKSNATALMLARAVVGRLGGGVAIETTAGRPCLMVRLRSLRPRSAPRPGAADPPG
jgi:signal transduction histidine kinase